MTYLPLTMRSTHATSLAYAQGLSVAMWDLCKHATSETSSIYRVIQHPETGQCVLVMDDERFFVQPDADPSVLMALVSVGLTQDELDDLRDAIVAARGSHVTVASLLPASVLGHALTEEEALTAGWIAEHIDPE